MILYIHLNSFSRKLKTDTKYYHLSTITLYPRKQILENFWIFVISNNKSFISLNLKVIGPLGRAFDSSVPRDLKFKAILITEPQNSGSTLSEL